MTSPQQIAESVLEIPEWKPWAILSLSGLRIDPYSDDRLIRQAYLTLSKLVCVISTA
jgi:hypothetical protein